MQTPSVTTDSSLVDRFPAPLRKLWDWFFTLPDGVHTDWRAYYAAARIRILFAVTFGFVYWHFYLTKRSDPFYNPDALDIFISVDAPLRVAWFTLNIWTLYAARPEGARWRHFATVAIEVFVAANIIIHMGATSSSFLFVYVVHPMIYRLGFDRVTTILSASLCVTCAMGGAYLSVTGIYPEAAFYSGFTRETLQNPQVSFLSIGNLAGGLFTGIGLAEWSRHVLDLREQELRRVNVELVTAMDEIARQQKQLAEAGALAAIGEFVRGAAHEIGNPLGSAHSLVSGVREDLECASGEPLDPKLREELGGTLAMALQGQERVRSIVSVLHALSIHTEVKSSTFELSHALKLAIDSPGPEKPAVRLDGDIPPVTIHGNCDQLGDAFGRIVQNAREFGRQDVTVRAEITDGGRRVQVTFTDDGPGFTSDMLKSALEPFSTSRKADKKHLGLGLFIARIVVGRMGGLVTVSNRPEGGARVTVELPAG